ncbi:phage major tail tube protein [Paraburkholderia terricola]|uniref:phage major tail tube protein n=1 Tax=Paraburkholderia terricola TaxID=169427 RepID=UPI001FD04D19|nr:phage major tail tube protein [Paraburkholderia terricola]
MTPETLYNFNVYSDGKGFAGRATQCTLPKLKIKTDDHRAGGMDAPVKVDLGMEALEAAFQMSTMERDVLKFFGLADATAFNGVFRGAFRDIKGATKAVATTFRGMLSEVDGGDWKPGEKVDAKFTVSLTYYKLEIDGAVVHEIDVLGMVRIINGVDQLAEIRKAIGM